MRSFLDHFHSVLRERHIDRVVSHITTALMCAAAFVTTFLLMSPAITMEEDSAALCGLTSHKHTDECYQKGILVCGLPEHEHDMACFSPALELYTWSCGHNYEHTHTEDCFIDGVLICSLEEHTHTDSCEKLESPLKVKYTEFRNEARGAGAIVHQGYYGSSDQLYWSIDADGELVIINNTPNSKISTYSVQEIPLNPKNRGWETFKDEITKVTIGEGIKITGNTGASLFYNYVKCETFDLANLDVSGATTMSGMFRTCVKAVSIDMTDWDTSNVTDMSKMFMSCPNLQSLDVTSFDTSNVEDMNSMFYGCSKLKELDLTSFDTSSVEDMNSMFCSCLLLESLEVSELSFDTSGVTDMSSMFNQCRSLESWEYSFDTSSVEDMSCMFRECSGLTELDLSDFDTSQVYDMSSMFENCECLESLDLTGFDTSGVMDMNYMFYDCRSLESLDLRDFDTSCVEDMSYMFCETAKLTEILGVEDFDTSSVQCFDYMFGSDWTGNSGLTSLDLSDWDTSSAYSFWGMFEFCSSLTELDVSGFTFVDQPMLDEMFFGCLNLTQLDLSTWDTSDVGSMGSMFAKVGGATEHGAEIILGEDFVIPSDDPFYDYMAEIPERYMKKNSDGSLDPSVRDAVGIAAYQDISESSTTYVRYYEIRYNSNDGVFKYDPRSEVSVFYRAGDEWSLSDAPEVTRSGYTLYGWDSLRDVPSTRINGNEWRLSKRFGQCGATCSSPAVELFAEWNSGSATLDTSAHPIAMLIETGDNDGNDLPEEEFHFTVSSVEAYGPESRTGTVTTTGEGSYVIDFGDLTFVEAGIYHLEILPTDHSGDGWVINRVPKIVYIQIDEDDNHGLVVGSIQAKENGSLTGGPVSFTHVYTWGKDTDELIGRDKLDSHQKNYTVVEDKDTLLKSAKWTDKENGEGEIELIFNDGFAVQNESRVVYLFCNCTAHGFYDEIALDNIQFLRMHFDYVDVISLEDQYHERGFASHAASFTRISEVGEGTDEVKDFLWHDRGLVYWEAGCHVGAMYAINILTEYFKHFDPTAIYLSFDGARSFALDAEPYSFFGSIYCDVLGNGGDYRQETLAYTDAQMATIKKLADYQRNGLYYLMTQDIDGYTSTEGDTHYYYYTLIKSPDEDYYGMGDGEGYTETAYRNMLYHFFATIAPAIFIDRPDDVMDMIDSVFEEGYEPIDWAEMLLGDPMLSEYPLIYGYRVYNYGDDFENLEDMEVAVGRKITLVDTIDKDWTVDEDNIQIGFYGVDTNGNVNWTACSSSSYTLDVTTASNGHSVVSVEFPVLSLYEPLSIKIPISTELEEYLVEDCLVNGVETDWFRATNIGDAAAKSWWKFRNTFTNNVRTIDNPVYTGTYTPELFKKYIVAEFSIYKESEKHSPLTGVEFVLYTSENTTGADTIQYNNQPYYELGTYQTNASGLIGFEDMSAAAYYLIKEVAAPEGYYSTGDYISFYFDENGKLYLTDDSLDGVSADNTNKITVVNYKDVSLPATGGVGTKSFFTVGMVTMLGAGFLLIKKKDGSEEN